MNTTMPDIICGIHNLKMKPVLNSPGYICDKCFEEIKDGEMSFKNLQDSMALVYKLNEEINGYKLSRGSR